MNPQSHLRRLVRSLLAAAVLSLPVLAQAGELLQFNIDDPGVDNPF
jgi:hypothetical protein